MIRTYVGLYLVFSYFGSWAQNEKTKYYSTGQLQARGMVINGDKVGEWAYFYPTGMKSAIENFDQGVLQMGQLQDSASYFYPSGIIQRRGVYEKSWYAGKWIHYFENGLVERIVNYRDGQPNDVSMVNNNNGVLI